MKTSVRILGEDQIDAFWAMCAVYGRRPHELAYDLVLAGIRDGQETHEVRELVAALREYRDAQAADTTPRRRLVYGGPGSRMGRLEMLRELEGRDRDE